MCRSRLQPRLQVATTRMKWETLQHHKEATFISNKGIFKVETNNLLNTSNCKNCNSTNFPDRDR
jgi:hypothetical protein